MSQQTGSGSVKVSSVPSEAELDALFESVSNWNRWGAADELGMLHHLTPERRAAARECVVDGTSISLAHDLGIHPTAETPYPAEHHMLAAGDARDDSGIPGYEVVSWFGVLAPAATPLAIRERVSKEMARILALPDVRERFSAFGAEPVSSTPQVFDAFVRDYIIRTRKLAEEIGMRVEG